MSKRFNLSIVSYVHDVTHNNVIRQADDIYKMIVQDSGSQYPLANLLQSCSKYTLDYYDVVLELLKDEAVCVVVAALRTACNYSLYNAAAGLEEFTVRFAGISV